MNFDNIKNILCKIEFQARMANLEIEAVSVGDIPIEEAEAELKKNYIAMMVWLLRLAKETGMNIEVEDTKPLDIPLEEFEQLPLF